ncbi:MAG: hypothetical protein AAB759_01250 [Patescibacteria group bacterium]
MSTLPVRHGEHDAGFTLGKVLAIVLGAMILIGLGFLAKGTLGPSSDAAEISSALTGR